MAQQELGTGKSTERPIRLGGALFTLVEPHRGHEVAYNRWYERDHFYAGCMVGAWTLAGARYVATADLKALRSPAGSPGSYLALYWIVAGHFGDWIAWGTDQVNWLHANDRMFPHRDHVHTGMYRFRTEFAGDSDHGVPAELALDHRSPYVVAVIGTPADGVELDVIDAWFADRSLGTVVGASFTPVPLRGDAPRDVPRDEGSDRFLQLWFVDDDLPATWADRFAGLGADFTAAGLGELSLVAPFRATLPGTDTYTDRLWPTSDGPSDER